MGDDEKKNDSQCVVYALEFTPKQWEELEGMVTTTGKSEEWVVKKALKLYFQAIKEFE